MKRTVLAEKMSPVSSTFLLLMYQVMEGEGRDLRVEQLASTMSPTSYEGDKPVMKGPEGMAENRNVVSLIYIKSSPVTLTLTISTPV